MYDEAPDSRTAGATNGRARWEEGTAPAGVAGDGASLGQIFKRLSSDTGALISQEVNLAKAELRSSAATAAQGGAKLGLAAVFGLTGSMAITAFAIIALGNLTGGNYWLWALVIGVIDLAIAVVLARGGIKTMKSGGLKPAETAASLKENKAWAAHEARELKHDMTSPPRNVRAST